MTGKLTRGPLFAEVHNVPDDYHFTAEELDRIIAGDLFTPRQGAIMARELQEYRKAAMDSKPVAWQIHTPETEVTYVETKQQSVENIRNGYGIKVEITPLYRHAQPAPVVRIGPKINSEMFNTDVIFGYEKGRKEVIENIKAVGIEVENE